jgi:hypothetical protein
VVGGVYPPTGVSVSAGERLEPPGCEVNSYLLTFSSNCVLEGVCHRAPLRYGEFDVVNARVLSVWSALRGVTRLQLGYYALERQTAASE